MSHCQVQGDRLGEAAVLVERSRLLVSDRAPQRGAELAERAVRIFRSAGQGHRLGTALYFLAVARASTGGHEKALEALEEALSLFEAAGQRLWAGLTQLRTTESLLAVAPAKDAVQAAGAAVRLFEELGDTRRWADGLTLLGHAYEASGDAEQAHACWDRATGLYETPNETVPRARQRTSPLEPGAAGA
ncbi:hypothetical protein GTY89_15935 [Streptomyces sp. SID5471]|nr:hypothetical protein [Streptomyces sp. SID5471]